MKNPIGKRELVTSSYFLLKKMNLDKINKRKLQHRLAEKHSLLIKLIKYSFTI